jgi:hypothetical protein
MSTADRENGKGVLLRADISDGYTIRNLFEYLKSTNLNGNLDFSKDGIDYIQKDGSNTIVNVVKIKKAHLTHYEYNAPTPTYSVGVVLSNLRKITKNIGKKDAVRFYMLKGEPFLYIRIMPNTVKDKDATRNNTAYFKPQTINTPPITGLPDYTRGEDDPNVTIPAVDFCKVCSNMCSMGCEVVTVRGFEKGIILDATLEGHSSGCIEHFGITKNVTTDGKLIGKDEKGSEQSAGNVRLKINPAIKAFSKLNNMTSAGGIIRIYMQKNKDCLKLVANIGAYGTLTVYLRNIPQ